MELKALFLNCTLKKSPETSNTQALIDKVAALMTPMGVECETVRLVDYKIPKRSAQMSPPLGDYGIGAKIQCAYAAFL